MTLNKQKYGNFDAFNGATRGAHRKEKGGAPEDARRGEATMNVIQSAQSFKAPLPTAKSQVSLITPEIAAELRKSAHFPRQRRIKQAKVQQLARAMSDGTFIQALQIYICKQSDGQRYVVNGNHTLEAIIASGVSTWLTVTTKSVSDLDEAGRIYAVFDNQNRRSLKESLDATGGGDGVTDARRVLAAIAVITTGFTNKFNGAVDRLCLIDMLAPYRESAEIFAQCVKGAPRANADMIRRAPVMAVALETIKHQPSAGEEFWSRAAHDDGLPANAPEKALLNWLRGNRANGETARRLTSNVAASAWNSAWKGEERKFFQPSRTATFFILGTPWEQGRGDV